MSNVFDFGIKIIMRASLTTRADKISDHKEVQKPSYSWGHPSDINFKVD